MTHRNIAPAEDGALGEPVHKEANTSMQQRHRTKRECKHDCRHVPDMSTGGTSWSGPMRKTIITYAHIGLRALASAQY